MPRPTSVDGGSVTVTVTLTVPVADAWKKCIATPPGAICPVNVSVPAAGAGVVGAVADEESLPHAAATSASAKTIANLTFM